MQALFNDPSIQSFLSHIPPQQQIITLKELIYIGMKIVNNSFQQTHNSSKQVVNSSHNCNKENNHHCHNYLKQHHEKKHNNKKPSKAHQRHYSKLNKVQPTLLREISKIRMQLQSLTNKVYDQCFEGGNNQNSQSENSISFEPIHQNTKNNQRQFYDQGQYDVPAFSPPKQKNQNPFAKQKDNFFMDPTQKRNKSKSQERNKMEQSKNSFVQRNRAKSNVMHLDDTQIRQALYKENDQEGFQNSRLKKSHSVIEQKRVHKKKQQQHYFHQLAIDKKRVDELKKIKKNKNFDTVEPQRDYQNGSKTIKNPYRNKAKSKIKKLVQRDRLRYQQKINEQNYKKGFEQYQYSANEFQEEQEESQNEDQYEQEDQYQSQNRAQQISKPVSYNQSQEQRSSNPNFGFYDSQNGLVTQNVQDNTFSNNAPLQSQQDNINACSDSSSFSQFSINGSSRKRTVGKISRRQNND